MNKYISADAFRHELKLRQVMHHDNMTERHEVGCIIEMLDNAPTADVVEVRHGEWGFDGIGWTCSQCGEYALSNKAKIQVHSVYCPNCGAKMDGERREECKPKK